MLFFRKLKRNIKKTISLSFLAIIVILVSVFWQQLFVQARHAKAFYYVYLGDKALKENKFHESVNDYKLALRLYPEHVHANYNLGNIFAAYEDYEQAVVYYENALKYDPKYLSVRISIGVILAEELVDFYRAIYHYEKAVEAKIFPLNIPFVYTNIDYIKTSKAIAYYNMGLAYRGKSLIAGTSLFKEREYLRKALNCYKKALKLTPKDYDTQYNLALTYHLTGNYDDALKGYCKAINLEPLNYEAHYNFALLLRDKMNYTESIRELEKAGIILDTKGDGYKTRYIYALLNDTTQRAVSKDEQGYKHLVEDIESRPSQTANITYLSGRVVVTEQLDKAVIQNMKTCDSCRLIDTTD